MSERRIETNIEINAPAVRIWALLTDFARMPSWNPFIKSISENWRKGIDYQFTLLRPANLGCGSSRPS
jgi:uncharacterized protein YndB with AHSA1/START domain